MSNPHNPYYEDKTSGIVLYHGDCRDILPLLGPVDCVLTDPPYGIGFSEYLSYADPIEGYKEFLWPIVEEAERHVTNGWMVVFQASKKASEWPLLIPRLYRVFACAKNFTQILPGIGPLWSTDFALFWPMGEPTQRGKGRDFHVARTNNMSTRLKGHPCPRPLDQIKVLMDCFSEEAHLILDPFSGSGTILLAAKQLGRRCIGIEIEEKYCEIIVERLRQSVLPFSPSPLVLPVPHPLLFPEEGRL